VTVGLTVSLGPTCEVPSAYNTGETFTFGSADHLDRFSNFKYIGLQFLPNFELGEVIHAEFLKVGEFAASSNLMPGLSLVQFACGSESDLDSFIAVSGIRLHLSDDTRPDLDCRNRFCGSVAVVVGCHSDLSTEKSSDSHFRLLALELDSDIDASGDVESC
jgi:hypothetical protein